MSAEFTFHHAEPASSSDAAAANAADAAGGPPRPDDAPVLDSGIKLPPDAEIFPVEVGLLHPTQLSVGMQQVADKAARVRKRQARGRAAFDAFLKANPVPVVYGPGRAMYLIDHHHLARALHECGVGVCYAGAARDLSHLDGDAFWAEMGKAGCIWPYAADGARLDPPERIAALLPNTVAGLRDDPYRSLAALVRKAGGFAKSTRPFAEFLWANHLRPLVPLALTQPGDVEHFVGRAICHATAAAAAHLPGHTPLAALTPAQLDAMADLGGLGGGGGKGGKKKKESKGGGGEEPDSELAAQLGERPAAAAAALAASSK